MDETSLAGFSVAFFSHAEIYSKTILFHIKYAF